MFYKKFKITLKDAIINRICASYLVDRQIVSTFSAPLKWFQVTNFILLVSKGHRYCFPRFWKSTGLMLEMLKFVLWVPIHRTIQILGTQKMVSKFYIIFRCLPRDLNHVFQGFGIKCNNIDKNGTCCVHVKKIRKL